MTSKRITKATLKAFIRKNAKNLYIRQESSFDGMTDGTEYHKGAQFNQVDEKTINMSNENTLGIKGVWLVGSSNNYFSAYEKDGFTGIHVYNCCGTFTVAIKSETKK